MPDDIVGEGIDTLKTIVKGAGIVFIGLIISKVLAFLLRIFIARYFGANDYGLFSIGLAVLGFFTVVAIFGVPSGVTRFIAHYMAKGDRRRVKGAMVSGLQIVVISSVISASILFLLSGYISVNIFHNTQLQQLLNILALSLPFSAVFTVFYAVFVAFQKIQYRVYTESIFQNLSLLVLVVILGFIGYGVAGLGTAWTTAAASAFLLALLIIYTKILPSLKAAGTPILIRRELLSYSMPLLLVGFMGFVVMWTDTIMIGYFLNPSTVGIYNAALPVALILELVPGALTSLFLPIITELHTRRKTDELSKVYKTVTRWTFYVNFPVFLLMAFFSRQLLGLLFGNDYLGGSTALVILSIGLLVSHISPSNYILQMLKKTKLVLYITVVSAAVNICLNYILIPLPGIFGGINGAAIATSTSYFILFVLMLAFSFRLTRIMPFSSEMLKSVLAGAVSIFAAYGIGRAVFTGYPVEIMTLLFMLFAVIYFIVLVLLKGVGRDDIEIIDAIENRSGLKIKFISRILKRFV